MPLNEYSDTDLISVTRQHLEEALSVLSLAYHYSAGLDLADAAREGRATARHSALTRRLERAYNHFEGYVLEPESEDDDVQEE